MNFFWQHGPAKQTTSPLAPPARARSFLAGLATLATLAAGLISPGAARAEDDFSSMVFTAGTTWHEAAANRDWGYVTWFGTTLSSIGGRTFAVYVKSGDLNSPTPFRRAAITALQTDPRVIEPLLQRSVSIGDNPGALQDEMAALFEKFVPAGLTRAEQVAAVIRGVLGDEKHFGNLAFLARTHPGMAMCLGMAHAEPIGPGLTTFEIRQFDPATQKDIAVLGRISVQANAPTVLPAPGAPVLLPAVAARGNLNSQLRWSTPDDLRRLMLLQHGFNLYRVRQDFAEAPGRQWQITPPTPETLRAVLGSTSAVLRLNHVPLMTSKIFSAFDVANFNPTNGDPSTIFYVDDNDQGRPGFPPPSLDFTNGAHFYYFAAARDLLGRDGLLSPGSLVTICDRLMPNALTRVRVLNDYVFAGNVPKHHLRVVWQQASNAPADDETIRRYWIYRWTNTHELTLNLQSVSNNVIAIVNHLPGAFENSYLDDGPSSPADPANLSKTYWYTVRAEDSGACGGNLSPHSPAVPGVLRDREGPAAPVGRISTVCLSPEVSVRAVRTNQNFGTPNLLDFAVNLMRRSDRIDWIDVSAEVRQRGTTNVLTSLVTGPLFFQPGIYSNRWSFQLPAQFQSQDIYLRALAGANDGQISPLGVAIATIGKLQEDTQLEFTAEGYLLPHKGTCDFHVPIGLNGSNDLNPVQITIIPTPTSRELRLYRRVDDGPLALICQNTWPANQLLPQLCSDSSFPAGASRICYYVQIFDQHGNGSPLTELGCIQVASPLPLPKPMLAVIDPLGDETSPQMRLHWFCPPAGVKRFEVGIAAPLQPGDNPADGQLIFNGKVEPHILPEILQFQQMFTSNQDSNSAPPKAGQFKMFSTPSIGNGSSFGSGAEFTLPVHVTKGVHYAVWVRAVSPNGDHGEKSNVGEFYWAPPVVVPLPTVAWPARPLPVVANLFGFDFAASWQTNAHNMFTGAVVQVGYIQSNVVAGATVGNWAPATSDFAARPQVLKATLDPLAYLPANGKGESPFPCALYRHQVANGKFPAVSGDVLQVSPLMESIAFQRTVTNAVANSLIRDPFIVYDGYSVALGNGSVNVLQTFLRDTQPVLAGARYRYLLVRFAGTGEIAEVIPTNEMEVP